MNTPTLELDAIRNCLEDVTPSVVITCSADGIPNVAYISQVHYLDNKHVALSYQFFNKTRKNILENPYAAVEVVDPDTAAYYQLHVRYLRTEEAGPIFENMKAKLAGIASHTGMSKVFRLLGADVYEVLQIDSVPSAIIPRRILPRSRLAALRASIERLNLCNDLSHLFDELLLSLEQHFGFTHSILLLPDESGSNLFTVGSRGYSFSGVGAEIPIGKGIIGVAAQHKTPIRIMHMAEQYLYSRASKAGVADCELEKEIPLPGLSESNSQIAVPISYRNQLHGVIYVESSHAQAFNYEDEDALVSLTDHLALMMQLVQTPTAEPSPIANNKDARDEFDGKILKIRHYKDDDSVFIDEDYLIKGVAGAIFWNLLRDYAQRQRTDFSNRELRLDPAIRLPDITNNLEARLILLQRRLSERCEFLQIEKTGRGRFRLHVKRQISLVED